MEYNDEVYHFQCQNCDKVFHVGYKEMVKTGWEVAVGRGYICPDCVGLTPYPTIPIEEAQKNRQQNHWKSLVEP